METKFETKVINNPVFRLNYFRSILPKLKEIRKYDGEKYSIIFDMENGRDHTSMWYENEEERDNEYEYYWYMKCRYNNVQENISLPMINIYSKAIIEKNLNHIIAINAIKEWNFIDNTFDLAIILDSGERIYLRFHRYMTMYEKAIEYQNLVNQDGTNELCKNWKKVYETIKKGNKHLITL